MFTMFGTVEDLKRNGLITDHKSCIIHHSALCNVLAALDYQRNDGGSPELPDEAHDGYVRCTGRNLFACASRMSISLHGLALHRRFLDCFVAAPPTPIGRKLNRKGKRDRTYFVLREGCLFFFDKSVSSYFLCCFARQRTRDCVWLGCLSAFVCVCVFPANLRRPTKKITSRQAVSCFFKGALLTSTQSRTMNCSLSMHREGECH